MSDFLNFHNLNIYYGIPHCHSSLSTGEGKPNDIFDYAKKRGLDFVIITDHNNCLDETIKSSSSKTSKWSYLIRCCEKYNKKHKSFVGLYGFESKLGNMGDINIINSYYFFKGTIKNLDNLILWLMSNPCILTLNHPHTAMESLGFDENLSDYVCLMEVGNGTGNRYTRFEKRYYKFLDMGWKVGAINSQDNHKMNFGDSENLTAILCNELTEENIYYALKNRRTYSTESASLRLNFSINKIIMGDILYYKKGKINFKIYAKDNTNLIEKLQILSVGGKVIKEICFPKLSKIKYISNHVPNNDEKWYVIKIFQENNKLAISSPIFIERNNLLS